LDTLIYSWISVLKTDCAATASTHILRICKANVGQSPHLA